MSSRFMSSYAEDVANPALGFEYERPDTEYEWRRHRGVGREAAGGSTGRGAGTDSDAAGAAAAAAAAVSLYSSEFEGVLAATAAAAADVAARVADGDPAFAPPPVLAAANKVEQTRPPREHPILCPLPIRSTAHREYGELGYNPAESNPRHPKEISLRASAVDLAAGTTKPTNHIPGYTGFLPADEHNVHARRQAVANYTRRSEKASSTLNVGREMVPGYAGYRPSSPSFNTNRSFRMYRESEYADSFYRKPQSAESVKDQRRKRALFAKVLNPWLAGTTSVLS